MLLSTSLELLSLSIQCIEQLFHSHPLLFPLMGDGFELWKTA